jgi:tetratricopeptide (TPR) repeat protein
VTTIPRSVPVLLLAALAACATTSKSAPAAKASASARGKAAESGAAPAARVDRLFQEALNAQDDQRKLNVPTDWPYLERKWRAVLDAGEVAEARFNLGVTLENQGKVDEAGAEYGRALSDKPSLRQAAVNQAVLLERRGDTQAAAAAYARVLREFPDDPMARTRLAALYQASGQTDDAWRLAREALLRDASSVAAYKVMVRIAVQRNDLDIAKLMLLRAEKLDPRDPEYPYLNGLVLSKQGDDAGATSQYKRALSRGEYLPARYALLEASIRKQAWGAVAENAQGILRAEPKNAPVHLVLGVAQRHLGKPDEALATYAQAEKLSGGALPEVFLARGVVYMRAKNQCEPAIEAFRAYSKAAGPVAAADSSAPRLERECVQVVEENRKAAEAAKQMQADAAKKAADTAAKKAARTGEAKPDAKAAPKPEAKAAAPKPDARPAAPKDAGRRDGEPSDEPPDRPTSAQSTPR